MEFWPGKRKRGQLRTLNAIFVQLLHHIFTPNSCQTHIRELLCIPIVQVIFKKKESQFKDTIINQFKLAMGVLCERSPLSHYEARNLCLSVCMSVCYSHISRAVHQINFTLVCGCPAGDTRNCCGSDNGAIWTCSNTFRMNTFLINSVQQWGGHGFGDWASWLCRLRLGSHLVPHAWVVQQLPVVTLQWEKQQKQSRLNEWGDGLASRARRSTIAWQHIQLVVVLSAQSPNHLIRPRLTIVWSPCCHLAKDTEVSTAVSPDYRAAVLRL